MGIAAEIAELVEMVVAHTYAEQLADVTPLREDPHFLAKLEEIDAKFEEAVSASRKTETP
ncbi:hypothetical protein MRBLMR1_001149 [Neorhizobium sp. LMR1-1-1.1]